MKGCFLHCRATMWIRQFWSSVEANDLLSLVSLLLNWISFCSVPRDGTLQTIHESTTWLLDSTLVLIVWLYRLYLYNLLHHSLHQRIIDKKVIVRFVIAPFQSISELQTVEDDFEILKKSCAVNSFSQTSDCDRPSTNDADDREIQPFYQRTHFIWRTNLRGLKRLCIMQSIHILYGTFRLIKKNVFFSSSKQIRSTFIHRSEISETNQFSNWCITNVHRTPLIELYIEYEWYISIHR